MWIGKYGSAGMSLRATWGVLRASPGFTEHKSLVDTVNAYVRSEGVASEAEPEVYTDKHGDEWLIFWTGFRPMNPFVPGMSSEAIDVAQENHISNWIAYASKGGQYTHGYLGYYTRVLHRDDVFISSTKEPNKIVRRVRKGRDELVALLKKEKVDGE